MVARYSDGPRYAEHAELVHAACATPRTGCAARRSLVLAEDDVAAFTAVTDAYRLPKGVRRARPSSGPPPSRPPRRCRPAAGRRRHGRCDRSSDLAERLLPVGNRNVISDIAAAAEAARAAATTARVNIEINLGGIADADARARAA